MANPLKGEVDLVCDGSVYTLRFTVDAIVQLEADLNLTVGEIGAITDAGLSVTVLLSMFWAGLLSHHKLSKTEASYLMDEVGIVKASVTTLEAFMRSFPTAEAANASARPQKAKRAGTG